MASAGGADAAVRSLSAWFFRAYITHESGRDLDTAVQWYGNILDVLDWGAERWKDVPNADRGYIFQKTFVRAIKRIRMGAYLSVSSHVSDMRWVT